MNGYLLLGKVLVSQVLPPNKKNPFTYHTSKQYTFINWKKNFVEKKNAVLTYQFRPKQKNRPPTSCTTSSRKNRENEPDSRN
jgi:hypothetical protein